MPVYSFSCGVCGWHEDQRVPWGRNSVSCPSCAATAPKGEVYNISVSGFTPVPLGQRTYRQEFRDFKEASAELEYAHGRAEETAGRKLATPPLAQIAKRKARELLGKGVKDSADWKSREKH